MSAPKPDLRTHFVYHIYDASDVLLYVGCTFDLDKRMAFHTDPATASETSRQIAARMARTTSRQYPSKAIALAAERNAIETEAPLLNKIYHPRMKKQGFGGTYAAVATA